MKADICYADLLLVYEGQNLGMHARQLQRGHACIVLLHRISAPVQQEVYTLLLCPGQSQSATIKAILLGTLMARSIQQQMAAEFSGR